MDYGSGSSQRCLAHASIAKDKYVLAFRVESAINLPQFIFPAS